MLKIIPNRPFTWNCGIFLDRLTIGRMSFSQWGEAGMFDIRGEAYRIYPESDRCDKFSLEQNKRQIAQAEKPNPYFRMFFVQHGELWYELKAESTIGRRFLLQQNGQVIGVITPEHWLTRRTISHLPDTIPLSLRLFMVWLVILLWRRHDEVPHQPSTADLVQQI